MAKFDIHSASAKDTYIFFLSAAQRKEELEKGRISQADIDRVGAVLTPKERDELFKNIPFERILLLIALNSLGKTEIDLEEKQNNLKKFNDWINNLNNAIARATEVNGKKEEKDRNFFTWDIEGLAETLREVKRFGKDKIDIVNFFSKDKEGGFNPREGMKPNLAIEQLRNIANFLDNEVKSNSTQIQKINSTYNTLLETLSFVGKKINDAKQSILSKL